MDIIIVFFTCLGFGFAVSWFRALLLDIFLARFVKDSSGYLSLFLILMYIVTFGSSLLLINDSVSEIFGNSNVLAGYFGYLLSGLLIELAYFDDWFNDIRYTRWLEELKLIPFARSNRAYLNADLCVF